MAKFALVRLASALATIFAMSLLVFVCVHLLPGDAATAILGSEATPRAVEALRRQLGLDEPLVWQYVSWAQRTAVGDLGRSLANDFFVADLVRERLSRSLLLAVLAAGVAMPLAIILGVVSALKRDSWLDRAISSTSLILNSLPEYFISYLAIIILARYLGLLPSISQVAEDAPFTEKLFALGLPILTLQAVVTPYMLRMTRAVVIRLLSAPYVEMARLKGMSERQVVLRHVIPNSIGPLASVAALVLSYLLVGLIIIEVVFVYPGIGQLMIDSIGARDIPVVQICGIIFGATYALLNFIADLLAAWSNPRLRRSGKQLT